MATIYLPVGSVSGTALDVAWAAQSILESNGHQVVLDETPCVTTWESQPFDAMLVCTSTTGMGDLPGSIALFHHELLEKCPLLNNVAIGIISLGDSMYDEFCNGGKQMEECIAELQGKQATARLTLDASETQTPESDIEPWMQEWMSAALG